MSEELQALSQLAEGIGLVIFLLYAWSNERLERQSLSQIIIKWKEEDRVQMQRQEEEKQA